MSFKIRRELLVQVIQRYREAGRNQKKTMLDEFVAITGYTRKYAIRLLTSKKLPVVSKICRPRVPFYGTEDQEIITLAWTAANFIASKRLAPFLNELIPALERHGHISINDETRNKLISISAATIDRILEPQRKKYNGRGISTTKPGALLKKQIPIRTFADWTENKPGFFEADLVAHCGGNPSGAFLYSLVLTDVATGWVECLPLLSKHQGSVTQALGHALRLIPFSILGIDTDCGTEFINEELIAFCEQYQITFTRGRAYKKNDQCFVEQKNGVVVRQLVGYDRFEGVQAYKQLNELYRATRLYVNFFQPSMKLRIKHRDSAKVQRFYDPAKTPFRRLLTEDVLNAEKRRYLSHVFETLDPIRLLQQIRKIQDALWKHSILEISGPRIAIAPLAFELSKCLTSKDGKIQTLAVDFMNKSLNTAKRKYRRSKKPRVPHTWRNVPDPFEDVWDEACGWLEMEPGRTAKSIFEDLQQKYPGKFKNGQLRTMQRRVKAWRSKAILTFDYEWLSDEILANDKFETKFQGKIIREAVL